MTGEYRFPLKPRPLNPRGGAESPDSHLPRAGPACVPGSPEGFLSSAFQA